MDDPLTSYWAGPYDVAKLVMSDHCRSGLIELNKFVVFLLGQRSATGRTAAPSEQSQ